MVTTRSGRSTDPTGSPGPISKLPVELLHEIAWSLPSVSSRPRPCELYPLATACKGFWECLRPLLFEFDVVLIIGWAEDVGLNWCFSPIDSPLSALAWGIANDHTTTAKFAIEVARSLGRLHAYTSVTNHYRRILPPFPTPRAAPHIVGSEPKGATLDPLSLAIIKGNIGVVELLTDGADVSLLNRALPYGISLRRTDGDLLRWKILVTPLHLAALTQRYDIAKLLLARFAEVDQDTLQWDEPTGLQLAAFLGDVKMARLMLDGEEGASPESPWVPRIRSQLLDHRAYDDPVDSLFYQGHGPHIGPPMIMGCIGSASLAWPANGTEIFALLAAKGRHLVTKPYQLWTHTRTPIETAAFFADGETPSEGDGMMALILLGALEPTPLMGTPVEIREYYHRVSSLPMLSKCIADDFIGQCWDAALEYHGGTVDDNFLKFWEEGISHGLPEKGRRAPGPTMVASGGRRTPWIIVQLEGALGVISVLERKSQGFAQLPAIRNWLDDYAFQEQPGFTVDYGAKLRRDWSHLVARGPENQGSD